MCTILNFYATNPTAITVPTAGALHNAATATIPPVFRAAAKTANPPPVVTAQANIFAPNILGCSIFLPPLACILNHFFCVFSPPQCLDLIITYIVKTCKVKSTFLFLERFFACLYMLYSTCEQLFGPYYQDDT